jgi:hypothetical protein
LKTHAAEIDPLVGPAKAAKIAGHYNKLADTDARSMWSIQGCLVQYAKALSKIANVRPNPHSRVNALDTVQGESLGERTIRGAIRSKGTKKVCQTNESLSS